MDRNQNIPSIWYNKIQTSEDVHVIAFRNDTCVELHNYESDVVEQFCNDKQLGRGYQNLQNF